MAAVAVGRENRLTAVLDRRGTLPGRGAYVCESSDQDGPNLDCMKLATRRGGLGRAFRRAVDVPAELVGPLESETR